MPLSSFFTGYRQTALAAGEILTAVEIPKPLPQSLRFYKIAKRRLDDISTVAAAMALDFDPHGVVSARPVCVRRRRRDAVRVAEAEDAVGTRSGTRRRSSACRQSSNAMLTPLSDHRGSKEYRLEVSKSPGREILDGSSRA